MGNSEIIYFVGMCLILLAGISAVGLYLRALINTGMREPEITLWVLFAIGMIGGISIVVIISNSYYETIRLIAIGFLILGGLSGITLFCRAIIGARSNDSIGNIWALFIIGMLGGIIGVFLS